MGVARRYGGLIRSLTTLALMLPAIGAAFTEAALATEQPDYEVVETLGDNIEIRTYPPLILAETVVAGDRDQAANAAFRILADYIFGNNQSREKIAMTAPVTQSRSEKIAMTAPVTQRAQDDGQWTVAFIMPSEYTMETLPTPNDDRVRIVETEPRRVAAIRFSGRLTDRNFEKRQVELLSALAQTAYKAAGDAEYAYYNGPFTPPFLRRNEVLIPLARD